MGLFGRKEKEGVKMEKYNKVKRFLHKFNCHRVIRVYLIVFLVNLFLLYLFFLFVYQFYEKRHFYNFSSIFNKI